MDLSAIPVDNLLENACASTDPGRRNEAVASIAREFEGVMVASMLKEGLKQAGQAGGGPDEPASPYMDMALEQMAYYVGRQGILGIADSIVDTFNAVQDAPHAEPTSQPDA